MWLLNDRGGVAVGVHGGLWPGIHFHTRRVGGAISTGRHMVPHLRLRERACQRGKRTKRTVGFNVSRLFFKGKHGKRYKSAIINIFFLSLEQLLWNQTICDVFPEPGKQQLFCGLL